MPRLFLSCLLGSLLLSSPVLPSVLGAAQAAAPDTQALLAQTRKLLTDLDKAESSYDRLDLAEKGIARLKPLLASQPNLPEALLLRGQLYVAVAAAKSEMGASAENYWDYLNREVMPWQIKAQDDLGRLIKLKTPLTAQAYFFRSFSYDSEDAGHDKDLKQACQLGYKPACAK